MCNYSMTFYDESSKKAKVQSIGLPSYKTIYYY